MKKSILSMVMALVMAFSCIGLAATGFERCECDPEYGYAERRF